MHHQNPQTEKQNTITETKKVMVVEQIKLHTGHDEKGEWKEDNKTANLVAHTILGAVVAELQGNSALVGGASAVSGELAAPIIQKALYGDRGIKDLTEEEKENLSALTQLAIGLTIASMGGDSSDITTGINSSKNAVENNMLAQAAMIAWRVIRPNSIGQPVTITAVDVLVGRGLSTAEAESFLASLTLEQRKLIDLTLVDPMGDSNFENVVQKTYESHYNEYIKKKSSNKNKDTGNALTGSTSGTASDGASLPPDDDDDKNKSDQTGTPPKTLQSGGNTINQNTADKLNQNLGTNYHRRDWGESFRRIEKRL